VYAGRAEKEESWNAPETGEEGVVAEVYLMPAGGRRYGRCSAGERGERGMDELGRTLSKGGSCGRGLSWLVGERGGGERFANGSVSRRSV